MVVTRAPTRIDFGGGWTDVPPYCDEEGGFVCNLAITRYATATVVPRADALAPADPLIAAALRRTGVSGVQVELASDFPIGAGLGGSSAACSAVYAGLLAHRGDAWDRVAIAEDARAIEIGDLGVPGGRQDYYAATHGGALGLTFTSNVVVERLALSEVTRAELARRAVLIYTGESRMSGDTVTAVLNAWRAGERGVRDALARMKALAADMARALAAGDLDALGDLVGEHWIHQRTLHPAIPTPRIDEIIARATAAGARGGKALGASGGGTVLVMAGADDVEQVRRALRSLGSELAFAVDMEGLAIR